MITPTAHVYVARTCLGLRYNSRATKADAAKERLRNVPRSNIARFSTRVHIGTGACEYWGRSNNDSGVRRGVERPPKRRCRMVRDTLADTLERQRGEMALTVCFAAAPPWKSSLIQFLPAANRDTSPNVIILPKSTNKLWINSYRLNPTLYYTYPLPLPPPIHPGPLHVSPFSQKAVPRPVTQDCPSLRLV